MTIPNFEEDAKWLRERISEKRDEQSRLKKGIEDFICDNAAAIETEYSTMLDQEGVKSRYDLRAGLSAMCAASKPGRSDDYLRRCYDHAAGRFEKGGFPATAELLRLRSQFYLTRIEGGFYQDDLESTMVQIEWNSARRD